MEKKNPYMIKVDCIMVPKYSLPRPGERFHFLASLMSGLATCFSQGNKISCFPAAQGCHDPVCSATRVAVVHRGAIPSDRVLKWMWDPEHSWSWHNGHAAGAVIMHICSWNVEVRGCLSLWHSLAYTDTSRIGAKTSVKTLKFVAVASKLDCG